MVNTLTLVRGPDWTRNGHGGTSKYRTFKLYLNGVMLENYTECSQGAFNYYTGQVFDQCLAQRVKDYERAAGVRCNRVTILAAHKDAA